VDPSRVVASLNPHRFILADAAPVVDEYGEIVSHLWRNENDRFFGARLRLNHYRVRSASEFAQKVERWREGGHPDLGDPDSVRAYWARCESGQVLDETILRFVPELRHRLANSHPGASSGNR
jgi:hypothetical protein